MEVVSRAKIFDVRIDADQGTVISSVEDNVDHDGIHDKKDQPRTIKTSFPH